MIGPASQNTHRADLAAGAFAGPVPEPDIPTALYDALSEALRTRPRHAGEAYAALREADRLLTALDACLRAGDALPEPWRRGGALSGLRADRT